MLVCADGHPLVLRVPHSKRKANLNNVAWAFSPLEKVGTSTVFNYYTAKIQNQVRKKCHKNLRPLCGRKGL